MGFLSSSVSVVCYQVQGKLARPINETVEQGLKQFTIRNIDNEPSDKAVGWTSFEAPFSADFSGASFSYGTYFLFSLRVDKKSIPAKVVAKCCALEAEKRLKQTQQKVLAKNEKKQIKEKVLHVLALRIPAPPGVFDLVWQYEDGRLWFFSTQKGANEELETLFVKTFSLRLVRLFPYTLADLACDLSAPQKDALFKLSPTQFLE